MYVDFYSDFSQLKYVFAEVITQVEIEKLADEPLVKDSKQNNPMKVKLKILEDEKKIIEDSNLKFKEENDSLKTELNDLNKQIDNFKNIISNQKDKISKFKTDKQEIEFLRLNLEHGHKCRKSFFNSKGFTVGTSEYKNCVLSKGGVYQ